MQLQCHSIAIQRRPVLRRAAMHISYKYVLYWYGHTSLSTTLVCVLLSLSSVSECLTFIICIQCLTFIICFQCLTFVIYSQCLRFFINFFMFSCTPFTPKQPTFFIFSSLSFIHIPMSKNIRLHVRLNSITNLHLCNHMWFLCSETSLILRFPSPYYIM